MKRIGTVGNHREQTDDGEAYEKSIRARLAEVKKKLNNFLKVIESGIFNDSTAERIKELEYQKSLLSDELIAVENRKQYDLKLEDIVKFLDSFIGDIDDPGVREKVLDMLVDKVYIDKDALTITFHYTDDVRELPYDETKELIDGSMLISDILNNSHRYKEETKNVYLDKMMKSMIGDCSSGAQDFF